MKGFSPFSYKSLAEEMPAILWKVFKLHSKAKQISLGYDVLRPQKFTVLSFTLEHPFFSLSLMPIYKTQAIYNAVNRHSDWPFLLSSLNKATKTMTPWK